MMACVVINDELAMDNSPPTGSLSWHIIERKESRKKNRLLNSVRSGAVDLHQSCAT